VVFPERRHVLAIAWKRNEFPEADGLDLLRQIAAPAQSERIPYHLSLSEADRYYPVVIEEQ
jgi:hypothetical protein